MNAPVSDLAVIGLAVMGENLILNMASHGFTVTAYNRTTSRVDAFLGGRAAGKSIVGAASLEALVASLKRPRKVMIMVKAGGPVDAVIDPLMGLLEPGDIVIDGGNSHYSDSERRMKELEAQGLYFIGTGVSGGEEGALLGPSIMPGGSYAAWPEVKPIFQAIAARTSRGEPCCEWVGGGGAGHFVKMVHNGIEYGDMQLIGETYHVMKAGLGMTSGEMQEVFREWNKGVLDSYLIEITRDILGTVDADGEPVVEGILDAAGQKGTGKWTVTSALDAGQPLTLIGEAVFARCLSAMKEERVAASRMLPGPRPVRFRGNRRAFLKNLMHALYASKIVSYAQGYQLMRAVSEQHGWGLHYGNIALMWRGGCIIRSAFLGKIKKAYDRNPDLANLMLDPFFTRALDRAQVSWRRVVATSARWGIPVPAIGSALAYYDGYRTEGLPANLLQAQRDYFGAHTYERTDRPRGEFFHTNWTGRGGATASTAYEV
ncbi:MAG TPA: decarboxylating NADP(+)-dependent phosphogluconate dehydrogenase [Kiritimatiellia bacterium]|nr:decarboxylating NADP(+)-dependent phosphogluconate dehydrogenase [Kiritimatiellia bacterium]